MDSVKDILAHIKQNNTVEDTSSTPLQTSLFDTNTIADNPKKVLGDKYKNITKEYQVYGARLAGKLGDKEHLTMYIKWAKEKKRSVLESALSFTIDYPNARNKARIFAWKVKELEGSVTKIKKKSKKKNDQLKLKYGRKKRKSTKKETSKKEE